jgi:hypothetical protein
MADVPAAGALGPGLPHSTAAFRKQVSRARHLLEKLIVKEVAQTLDDPTPEQLKEELIDLALWEYIHDHLLVERWPPHQTA